MDIYSREDFEENDPVDTVGSEDTQDDHSDKSDSEGTQEEEYDEEEGNEQEEIDLNPMDEVLSRTSTQARCTILTEEIRLLKLENDLLLSRENSLKQRLKLYDDDNKVLNTRLLESEKQAANLNKQIELIKCKSDARQTTLENSYKDLCSKIAASEEANQKMRFYLNEQKAKNLVLEDLVESKTTAIAELERRLEHLTPTLGVNVSVNGVSEPFDNAQQLTYRLHATEQQLDQVVSELSRVVSHNANFKNSLNTHTNKYFDYNAMLKEYNSKCVRLKELEERLRSDDNKNKIALLEDEIRLLKQKLANRTKTLKENDKELKDFYSKQMEELKNMISEQKLEASSSKEEYNKIKSENESLIFQLDLKNKSLMDKTEHLEQVKSQYQELAAENEALKRSVEDLMEKSNNLKMELQLVLDRENTHMAEFKNYARDMDLKLQKFELVLVHNHQIESQVKQQERLMEQQKQMEREREEEHARASKEGSLDEEFKREILEEFSEVKHLINSLEKSKKEQQQINNLILTLRHQNDTVLSTLKDENKNTLNSFSERNNASLSELKQENSKVVATLTDKVSSIMESIKKKDESLVDQINKQFELLKEELKALQVENPVQRPESALESPQEHTFQQQELEDKYKKLKESFKNTTASLLRKEKILLDSLKKTVLECHTYKEKLEKLSGSTPEPRKCNCVLMVKCSEAELKSFKNCWCRFKTNNGLRISLAKRARECETAALDSIKMLVNKRRALESNQ